MSEQLPEFQPPRTAAHQDAGWGRHGTNFNLRMIESRALAARLEQELAAITGGDAMVAAQTHPMQPTVLVEGVLRFKANAIVVYLLEHGGIDMNDLARLQFSEEDHRQFAQLIGYSVSGYGDLGFLARAAAAHEMKPIRREAE